MAGCPLPGFKASCLTVGGLNLFLAGGLLARGIPAAMAPFGVLPQILASPHYLDAMHWTYTHMCVLALIIGALGLWAQDPRLRRNMARLLFFAHLYYTFLDFRASDSILGTGLYKGSASLIPAFISLFVTLVFLHLGFCPKHTHEPDVQPSRGA
ncbi:MAG TPA: hypothetical protein V6D23_19455 [Candidatus Obscuribacterales bacterium]